MLVCMNDYETGLHLWKKWTEMWNGAPELARELAAPRFALHLPTPGNIDPTTVTTPDAVVDWVAASIARFDEITFRYDAGPFVDTVARIVAGPWSARIVAAGKISFVCGMDTIAFEDGKLTEYWTLSKDAESVDRWTRRLAP